MSNVLWDQCNNFQLLMYSFLQRLPSISVFLAQCCCLNHYNGKLLTVLHITPLFLLIICQTMDSLAVEITVSTKYPLDFNDISGSTFVSPNYLSNYWQSCSLNHRFYEISVTFLSIMPDKSLFLLVICPTMDSLKHLFLVDI